MYLGIDLGTQSIKSTIIDSNGDIVLEVGVGFEELGLDSFIREGNIVTTDPCIWLKAIDELFDKLHKENPDILPQTKLISGSAQQHGSVYWKASSEEKLGNMSKSIYESLKDQFECFSPIWMDQSTNEQCKRFEKDIGGFKKLYEVTGSRAYERFSGTQISKISETNVELFNRTERIGLVSSLMGSILIGKYSPIDKGDASGMNLLNITSGCWDPKCIEIAVGKDLSGKLLTQLGEVVESNSIVGTLNRYFVEKYNMKKDCEILCFTGDNLSSVACLIQKEGDVICSLGTSHTVLSLTNQHPVGEGQDHVFISPSPIGNNRYIRMTCIKNGGLVRESVKKRLVQGKKGWEEFNKLIDSTKPGNNGQLGFYFHYPEIIPRTQKVGVFRFSSDGILLEKKGKKKKNEEEQEGDEECLYPPEVEARAILEQQIFQMRVHSRIEKKDVSRLIVTGGGSLNEKVLQIISSMFDADVYVSSNSLNSASMGGAVRCLFFDGKQPRESLELVASPNSEDVKVYQGLFEKYQNLEDFVVMKLN